MDATGWALRAGLATHVGRVREHNEDAAVADGGVYAVADGMGGHAAGEVASAVTAATLAELADRTEVTADEVRAQLVRANERILARAHEDPRCTGMATTVTGVALVHGPRWLVFNVGDSRVYRYADGSLRQLTVDHSEVALLVAGGYLTPEEARVHPLRNIVTRCLGRAMPRVDTWDLAMTEGEVFVVCSDGLTGELQDEEIAHVLRSGGDPQTLAERLVRLAVEHGGHDNVTVAVVQVAAAQGSATNSQP
ncbi:MAG: PP2C family protein-serine/threonine phosphatase [Dermatophilaceae bacterium]